MTARQREMIKPVATPKNAIGEIRKLTLNKEKVGIIFGPERKGLDNDSVALADTIIRVPLNSSHSSMNLGHAVMIMSYEWFQSGDNTSDRFLNEGRTGIATKEQLINFFVHLERELDHCGFFKILEKRQLMVRNIRNIFQRMDITQQEVRTLHGIVSGLVRGPKTEETDEPAIDK